MNVKIKIITVILLILFVFTAAFTYGYRREIKNQFAYIYENTAKTLGLYQENKKVWIASVSENAATDENIIKKAMPVVFVDRKHKITNGKDTIQEDVIKRTTAGDENLTGKKVKDVYKLYMSKGYKISAGNEEIVCVKIHTKGKYVAKLNGDNYEIYVVNDKGELVLKESGGNINHKGEDEIIFNKDPQEFNTIEEARESLSDFTS